MWDRLSAEARAVMRLALEESEQLGHGHVGDEHILLGLLRDHVSPAASLLRGHGLDLASARAELQRLSAAGLMPRSRADEAGALRAVGIDIEAVRRRLVAAFGARRSAPRSGGPAGGRGGAAAAGDAHRCAARRCSLSAPCIWLDASPRAGRPLP